MVVDLMRASSEDFPSTQHSHPVHYHYGLTEFLVLAPDPRMEKEDIDNETRAKMTLSAAAVAVHNTGSPVPFFVQVMGRRQLDQRAAMFDGIYADQSRRITFEMISLSRRPARCSNLSDVLALFKEKLSPSAIDVPCVRVTARFAQESVVCVHCFFFPDRKFIFWSYLHAQPDVGLICRKFNLAGKLTP